LLTGEGVDEEPNHMTRKKAWSSINHSILAANTGNVENIFGVKCKSVQIPAGATTKKPWFPLLIFLVEVIRL
jgi:hypothetical protein